MEADMRMTLKNSKYPFNKVFPNLIPYAKMSISN